MVSAILMAINPFLANFPILYPLKTPENLWFSGVFREYKMGTLARNRLKRCSKFKKRSKTTEQGYQRCIKGPYQISKMEFS